MTVAVATEKYLQHLSMKECSNETIRGYRILLREFDYITRVVRGQEVTLTEIEPADIEHFLVHRKMKGDQPSSRNRHYYILKGYFCFLEKRGLLIRNPMAIISPIKVSIKERPYLKLEDMKRICLGIEQETVRTMVFVLSYTGMRISEVCQLKLEDIDLDDGIIRIVNGKGNKSRSVPINRSLESILRDYVTLAKRYKGTALFFSTNRNPSVSPDYINREIKKSAIALGFTNIPTAHIFRHSFASALVYNNAPLPSVQKLLGHADLRITSRYIHQSMNELKDAVALL